LKGIVARITVAFAIATRFSAPTIVSHQILGKHCLQTRRQNPSFVRRSKELGAAECFGFDARQHWVEQAEFLLANRDFPKEGIRFSRLDLLELPQLKLPAFDITWFSGIFYHLPDPIAGLKIAADLTKEVLMVNTAWKPGPVDALIAGQESTDLPMSGMYGLNWHPTGPEVLQSILRWLGFKEFRLAFRNDHRLALWASRTQGLLKSGCV
ncbi:MAG TPA: hypothetical protein VIK18_10035, partial [Pirellulales bacterium]